MLDQFFILSQDAELWQDSKMLSSVTWNEEIVFGLQSFKDTEHKEVRSSLQVRPALLLSTC